MNYPVHKSIIIVASGPSAKDFSPPPDIPVIVVNGVIDWIDRADYWFTLDPSAINMERMKRQRRGTYYYCACPGTYRLPENVFHLHRLTGVGPLQACYGLTDQPNCVNTGNSAYGALGLARHMKAEKVFLIGVDATTEERCEGGFSRDLSHLPLLFDSALGQRIKLASASNLSHRIPQMTIEDGLNWLRGE